MNDSRDRWIVNRYPLIEADMSRRDCADSWSARYDRPLERSACVACPPLQMVRDDIGKRVYDLRHLRM